MESIGRSREAGMSALEVVLLAPFIIAFIMVLVYFGILVDANGSAQGVARDAARMGSLQRDWRSALNAANQAAQADDVGGACPASWHIDPVDAATKDFSTQFAPGQLYTVKLTCTVSWAGLPDKTFVIYATAPLDFFRRTAP
jgi:Flp pilus assembly protein TadG